MQGKIKHIEDSFIPDNEPIKYMDYQNFYNKDSDAKPVSTNKIINIYGIVFNGH